MEGNAPKLKGPPGSLHTNSALKRSSPSIFGHGQPKNKISKSKRVVTKQDFLDFCITVLKHEGYKPADESCEKKGISNETDYDMNTRASPARDLGGNNSDSGGSNGAHGYDGSSTATAASSSSACGSSDEEEAITCFCKKPYANRPMIECGSCETWIHLTCAKIRRNHIPDVYICKKCQEASQSARKSVRPKSENKKFVEAR